MKIYVVHIYDAADRLHDYYVHGTIDSALRQASCDVVDGRFEDADPDVSETERARVLRAVYAEPGVNRWHVRCDAWRAHVDEMHLIDTPDAALPVNPECREVIGTVGACGHESYYCSDRCWTIGQLKAARARVAEYEQRLGVAREVRV